MPKTEVSGSQIKDSSVALSGAASPTGNADVAGVLPAGNGGTGLSSPGASGNVLTSDGTGWTTAAPTGGGGGGAANAGVTSVPTAAGVTLLSSSSTENYVFTGVSTQTVRLPPTATVGAVWKIINQSTGLVTVQSSAAAAIVVLAAGTSAIFTALTTAPTAAANWTAVYNGSLAATGKKLTVNNTLTLSGTDATTMTFPTTNATIARTDAAQTFTGVQTMTMAGTLSAPTIQGFIEATTTASVSTAYTFAITASTQFIITLTANTTCTFTMPAASTTNSFTVQLRQPAATGNGAASFLGVRWPTNGVPTITTTAGRMDIINFLSDGTNWYGSYVQGYIY
jgi:hypothetical protein